MKRALLMTGVLAYMLAIGTETAHAQQVSLDDAIQNAATELSAGIGAGTRIAVLAMQADPVRMSNYLIDEMIVAFVRAGRFTVVNRAQLDLLAGELHFNMSEWVDEMTAQSIGRFMGVQSIVTGTFEPIAGFFRFRVQVIEVETAAIRAVYTANVRNDYVISYLRGVTSPAARATAPTVQIITPYVPAPPPSRPPPRAVAFQDRVNWLSGGAHMAFREGGGFGSGINLRYERDIDDRFSVGGTAFGNFGYMLDIGISATARLFLSVFFFELGLGFGMFGLTDPDDGWYGGPYYGLLITPAIGVRLGGRTRGFFASPFFSASIGVMGSSTDSRFMLGTSVGRAW